MSEQKYAEMFAIYGSGEPEETRYEYEIGEIITVNTTKKMMCKKKTVIDGKLYQFFKEGRLVFD
jgi:hypothetical protein